MLNVLSIRLTWTRTFLAVSTGSMSTAATHPSSGRTGALMALGAMTCVQIGLAVSIGLFDQVGPQGAAWLRLGWAGVLLLVAVRPRPSTMHRPSLVAAGV